MVNHLKVFTAVVQRAMIQVVNVQRRFCPCNEAVQINLFAFDIGSGIRLSTFALVSSPHVNVPFVLIHFAEVFAAYDSNKSLG